jgi:hypothetical protein
LRKDSLPDLDLAELCSSDARNAVSAATARIMAYWADECARDLDRLMTHFTSDAEVVTPDGVSRGREAVASLYQKSFDAFPGLTVDVKATFVGREAHCFEYSAVLSDAVGNHWVIEGVNLMKLEHGLIASLRSFEDAPRRLPAGSASTPAVERAPLKSA